MIRTRSPALKPAEESTVIEELHVVGVIEITDVYVLITPEILGEPSDPFPNPSAKSEDGNMEKANTAVIPKKIFRRKNVRKIFFSVK
jgi:hypothetical protein